VKLHRVAMLTAALLGLGSTLCAQGPYGYAPPQGMPPYATPAYGMPAYGVPPPGAGAAMYGGMPPGYGGPWDAPPEATDSADLFSDAECPPTISVGVEAMLLKRTTARPFTLVRQGAFDLNGADLLNADNLDFDHEIGPRVDIVVHRPSGLDFGFTYFEVLEWESEGVATDPVDVSTSAPNQLLNNFNTASVTYDSQFTSAELNLLYRVHPRVTLLAGLRWMHLKDTLLAFDNFGPDPNVLIPSYSIRVENDLSGAQVGILATLLRAGAFTLDCAVKGGYYALEAEHQMVDIQNVGTLGSISAINNDMTTVIDVGLTASLRLGRHAKVWLGYQAMWLTGVATAPSQIAGNDLIGIPGTQIGAPGALGVDVFDNLMFYGARAGVEFSY
jgi:hypothetical protein